MTTRTRNILFILLTIVLIAGGGIYFLLNFFRSFAPDDIAITKSEIRSSNGFINPITIEKLKVDSLGKDQRPIKYTIDYITTFGIKQKDDEPPVGLKQIKLNESGRYSWSEENVNISIVHDDGYSKRISSVERLILSMGNQNFETCPLKFEEETWYFINFLDPQVVGVYIYIDKVGVLHKYAAYSGVSPI